MNDQLEKQLREQIADLQYELKEVRLQLDARRNPEVIQGYDASSDRASALCDKLSLAPVKARILGALMNGNIWPSEMLEYLCCKHPSEQAPGLIRTHISQMRTLLPAEVTIIGIMRVGYKLPPESIAWLKRLIGEIDV